MFWECNSRYTFWYLILIGSCAISGQDLVHFAKRIVFCFRRDIIKIRSVKAAVTILDSLLETTTHLSVYREFIGERGFVYRLTATRFHLFSALNLKIKLAATRKVPI